MFLHSVKTVSQKKNFHFIVIEIKNSEPVKVFWI